MKPKRFSLTIVLLLLLNILSTKITLANNWEVAFVIINDQGNPTSLPITVYLFNENTRNYDYHDSGYTSGNFGQIQIDGIWRLLMDYLISFRRII